MRRFFALLLVPAFQQIVPVAGHGAAPVGLHLWAMTLGLQPFAGGLFLAALAPVACLVAACLVPSETPRRVLYSAGLTLLVFEVAWLLSISERALLTFSTALTFVGVAFWSLTEWFVWPSVTTAPPPRTRAAAALMGMMAVEGVLGICCFLWMIPSGEQGPPLSVILIPVCWGVGLVLSGGAVWKGWWGGFAAGFVLSALPTGNTLYRVLGSPEVLGGRFSTTGSMLAFFRSGPGILMGAAVCVLLVLEFAGRKRAVPSRAT